jgi:predicted cupin superfamily sugar epimerase
MSMPVVQLLINQFELQPHPEGGWYKQTYESGETIVVSALPSRFPGNRSFSTAIYFLLEKENFSAFHRIKSDECWHFYSGDPLNVYIIHPDGKLETVLLGSDFEKGQQFQFVVPANCWFASRPAEESEYCFVGCTVAPGFDFEDFELANADELSTMYPHHTELIRSLVRCTHH